MCLGAVNIAGRSLFQYVERLLIHRLVIEWLVNGRIVNEDGVAQSKRLTLFDPRLHIWLAPFLRLFGKGIGDHYSVIAGVQPTRTRVIWVGDHHHAHPSAIDRPKVVEPLRFLPPHGARVALTTIVENRAVAALDAQR